MDNLGTVKPLKDSVEVHQLFAPLEMKAVWNAECHQFYSTKIKVKF